MNLPCRSSSYKDRRYHWDEPSKLLLPAVQPFAFRFKQVSYLNWSVFSSSCLCLFDDVTQSYDPSCLLSLTHFPSLSVSSFASESFFVEEENVSSKKVLLSIIKLGISAQSATFTIEIKMKAMSFDFLLCVWIGALFLFNEGSDRLFQFLCIY